jgi:hypothetical protein
MIIADGVKRPESKVQAEHPQMKSSGPVGYIDHALRNFSVCWRCAKCIVRQSVLLVFHLVHGLIPIRITRRPLKYRGTILKGELT